MQKKIDLFTIADEPIQIDNHSFTMSPKSDILQPQSEEIIADPQPLEIEEKKVFDNSTDNQPDKIKKIIFFYENGKFKIFEP